MDVLDRLVSATGARRVRDGEYRGRCPVHGGRSRTSLSLKLAWDRVLVYCHAGCRYADILAAVGLSSDGLGNPNVNVHERLKHLAEVARERQRGSELHRVGEELRRRDQRRIAITEAVRSGAMTEEQAWNELDDVIYRGYSELKWKFDRLLGEDK